MKENLNQTIELLRTRVNSNLERIRNNEKVVRRMIEENSKGDYSDDISSIREINRKLLEENNEAIKIQMSILTYITRYRKEWESDASMEELIYSEVSEEEIFEQTVSGKMKFSRSHPRFNDDSFVEKLIMYYSIAENYEMCDQIIKMRK